MSYSHLDHLQLHTPQLLNGLTLDLGCGKGKLVAAIAQAGGRVVGLEYNPAYIEIARAELERQGLTAEIKQGKAEQIPWSDNYFDFVNMSELIEHVDDPTRVLSEVYRVLKPGGRAYLSIPNRFGAYDPHFHLWGINWLPRQWADKYSRWRTRQRIYSEESGRQSLARMHYYSYRQIVDLIKKQGFTYADIRWLKLRRRVKLAVLVQVARLLYWLPRQLYFNSFHFLLAKPAPVPVSTRTRPD